MKFDVNERTVLEHLGNVGRDVRQHRLAPESARQSIESALTSDGVAASQTTFDNIKTRKLSLECFLNTNYTNFVSNLTYVPRESSKGPKQSKVL